MHYGYVFLDTHYLIQGLFLFAKQDILMKGAETVRQVIKSDIAERELPAVSSDGDSLCLVIHPHREVVGLTLKWLHS